MLEVGNGGMTSDEYRAHISLWALLNAPLMAGNDLRRMDATTHDLLTNREMIAVDQDWGGTQGREVAEEGDLQVWAKPMSSGAAAVVLLNRGTDAGQAYTTAADLGLPLASAYDVRDLWAHISTTMHATVDAWVPPHTAKMLIVASH
jgi:alpha-galactosidase